MTIKELWHIKLNTVVRDTYNDLYGKVIKRELSYEISGFILSKNRKTGEIKEKDIKTGRKLLTVTVQFENGYKRFYDTSGRQYILKNLEIVR